MGTPGPEGLKGEQGPMVTMLKLYMVTSVYVYVIRTG